MKELINVVKIKYPKRDVGYISIALINDPYKTSDNEKVVSIGVSLKDSQEPTWKIHIPKESLSDVISALTKLNLE